MLRDVWLEKCVVLLGEGATTFIIHSWSTMMEHLGVKCLAQKISYLVLPAIEQLRVIMEFV